MFLFGRRHDIAKLVIEMIQKHCIQTQIFNIFQGCDDCQEQNIPSDGNIILGNLSNRKFSTLVFALLSPDMVTSFEIG